MFFTAKVASVGILEESLMILMESSFKAAATALASPAGSSSSSSRGVILAT
jgi:hypothetical protein